MLLVVKVDPRPMVEDDAIQRMDADSLYRLCCYFYHFTLSTQSFRLGHGMNVGRVLNDEMGGEDNLAASGGSLFAPQTPDT